LRKRERKLPGKDQRYPDFKREKGEERKAGERGEALQRGEKRKESVFMGEIYFSCYLSGRQRRRNKEKNTFQTA